MTTIKKGELINIRAEESGTSKKEAEVWINDAFSFFETVLTEYGVGFTFGDISTYDVVDVEEKEHKRRNPQTGEEFMKTTAAHYALKHKVRKPIKDKLKELKANEE